MRSTRPARGAARRTRGQAAIVLIAALAGAPLAGCSGEGPHAPPVDPPRAREALRAAMESWRKGEKIEALKSSSPPIVVQDFDWMGGQHLVSYEVLGDGKDDDANLRIPVRLTLQGPTGREVRKDVRYVVGTSPTLTVFREMF